MHLRNVALKCPSTAYMFSSFNNMGLQVSDFLAMYTYFLRNLSLPTREGKPYKDTDFDNRDF
jgi:hypothetical protein